METLREKRLVSGIKEGDMELLKEFYFLNRGRIHTFIQRYINDQDLARFILNEVFINTWLYADEYDDKTDNIENWLISIASFTIVDILKKTNQTAILNQVLDNLPKTYLERFLPQ